MIFTSKCVVRGVTQFAGNIDGEDIEANTAFIDVELDSKHGGYGSRTAPKRCKDKDVIDRIKHNPFPFIAEVTFQELATKGKETMVITEIKPLSMLKTSDQPLQQKAA